MGLVDLIEAMLGGGQVVDGNQLGKDPVIPGNQAANLGCTHYAGAMSPGVLLEVSGEGVANSQEQEYLSN